MLKFSTNKKLILNSLNQIIRRNACMKHPNDAVLFRQLVCNETYTYTYLLADAKTHDAVIIDPVYEKVERDCNLIKQLDLNLKYASQLTTRFFKSFLY